MHVAPMPDMQSTLAYTMSAAELFRAHGGWSGLQAALAEGVALLGLASEAPVVVWLGVLEGVDSFNQTELLVGWVFAWSGDGVTDELLTVLDAGLRGALGRVVNEGGQMPGDGFFPSLAWMQGRLHVVFHDVGEDQPLALYLHAAEDGLSTFGTPITAMVEGFPSKADFVVFREERIDRRIRGPLETAFQFRVASMLFERQARPGLQTWLQEQLGFALDAHGFLDDDGAIDFPRVREAASLALDELPVRLSREDRQALVQEVVVAALEGAPITSLSEEEAHVLMGAYQALDCA